MTEGDVQQRLVVLAFDQLVGTAPSPDRLADAAEPPAAREMAGRVVVPCRDDPPRVPTRLAHVGERDPRRVRTQFLLEGLDLVRRDHHEHRLATLEALPHESRNALHEVGPPGVEQGLMTEAF
jgi:hypothetical protein